VIRSSIGCFFEKMKSMMMSASIAAVAARDLSTYSFTDFVGEFNKEFLGEELQQRQEIFESNMKKVLEHNANPDKSWTATVTKFADLTADEFAANIKGRKHIGTFGGVQELYSSDVSLADLPDRVDWREKSLVTEAKDQGGCGSCWAFSATETFESHLAIATNEPIQKLSPQQIVSCSPNPQQCGGSGGCDGSTQPLAFNYTVQAGLTTEENYPYAGSTGTCKESKIVPVGFNSGYTELPVNDYTALMTAVATKGPIAISIAAGGFAFQFYGGGVLKNCNDYDMDHAVQLVGYGTDAGNDYWLVRNSWGGSWGESGYIRMKRYGEGNEPCGTDSTPQDGDACKGDNTPRKYCGECGILSSSSYPTGMRKASSSITV